MRKMIFIAAATLVHADSALAHPAVVDHDHPHGASALLGLDTLAAVAGLLAVAAGWRIITRWRK